MNDNFTPEMDGEAMEPILLTDEEGNEYPFDLLDVVTYEGTDYAVFFPSDDDAQDSDEEEGVVILKVIPYEDGSAAFDAVEDTAILDAVFEIFMENLRQAFDGEE